MYDCQRNGLVPAHPPTLEQVFLIAIASIVFPTFCGILKYYCVIIFINFAVNNSFNFLSWSSYSSYNTMLPKKTFSILNPTKPPRRSETSEVTETREP